MYYAGNNDRYGVVIYKEIKRTVMVQLKTNIQKNN